MDRNERMKLLARDLRAVAQTGLAYGRDVYDVERYGQVDAVARGLLSFVSGKDMFEIEALLPIESGYATPKVAVRGLLLDGDRVLMVREAADGLWTLPGGWCDVGLSPAENVVKEVREETGLCVEVVRLLGVFDQGRHRESVSVQAIYVIYFLCEFVDGCLQESVETTDVDFYPYDDLLN